MYDFIYILIIQIRWSSFSPASVAHGVAINNRSSVVACVCMCVCCCVYVNFISSNVISRESEWESHVLMQVLCAYINLHAYSVCI